jgi:hypothetical protein
MSGAGGSQERHAAVGLLDRPGVHQLQPARLPRERRPPACRHQRRPGSRSRRLRRAGRQPAVGPVAAGHRLRRTWRLLRPRPAAPGRGRRARNVRQVRRARAREPARRRRAVPPGSRRRAATRVVDLRVKCAGAHGRPCLRLQAAQQVAQRLGVGAKCRPAQGGNETTKVHRPSYSPGPD